MSCPTSPMNEWMKVACVSKFRLLLDAQNGSELIYFWKGSADDEQISKWATDERKTESNFELVLHDHGDKPTRATVGTADLSGHRELTGKERAIVVAASIWLPLSPTAFWNNNCPRGDTMAGCCCRWPSWRASSHAILRGPFHIE